MKEPQNFSDAYQRARTDWPRRRTPYQAACTNSQGKRHNEPGKPKISKKKSLLLLQLPDGEKEPSRCQKEIIRWQPVMLVKINKHQLFDPLQGRYGRRGVTSHPSALHKQQGNIWFWGIINFVPFGGKEEWLRVGVSWKRCSSTFAYLHIFPWIPL